MVIGAHKRHDELICNTFVVGFFHSLNGIGVLASFAVAINHRIESLGYALPATVAVHGIVTSIHGSDLSRVVLTHFLLELLQIPSAAGGQRVPPVHKGVHENALNVALASHF